MFDVLFINGTIYTMKEEGDCVEALGIKEGIIEFVGTNDEAARLMSKETVDLAGKTMLPGMVDAHMHMYAYCQNQTFVDLQPARSINDILALLKEKKALTPKGEWIKGVNFDQSKCVENRFPTRADLDSVSREHPIVIKRCCLHAVVANTRAMELVGLINEGHEPRRGDNAFISSMADFIDCDETGVPNGIVREQATKIFDDIMPDPLGDDKLKKRIMSDVMADMSSKGITGIHTYAAKIWQYNEDIALYKRLMKEGTLPLRVTVCLDELFDLAPDHEEKKKEAFEMVHMGAYKLFTDGSLGSKSAFLKAPYSDDPSTVGVTVCSQAELDDKVLTAYRKGLQPAIHAIGDGALDMTLTAIENCLQRTLDEGMTLSEQEARLPFRIIHVQMIDPDLLARMKALPLVLDIQPIFLCTDLHWIEDRLGPDRMKMAYTWKTLSDEGLIQTGGSDCPVEDYAPLKGVFAAVQRTDDTHYPVGGFYPEEKLSVFEALSLFTVNPHFATGQESVLGTLEVGKFGDVVVLGDDPFQIEPGMLKDLQVLKTFIAGKCVYNKM